MVLRFLVHETDKMKSELVNRRYIEFVRCNKVNYIVIWRLETMKLLLIVYTRLASSASMSNEPDPAQAGGHSKRSSLLWEA